MISISELDSNHPLLHKVDVILD